MNNVLYSSTIVPARESEDGETPTILYCCKENNGYAIFLSDYAKGTRIIKYLRSSRNEAIEFAVSYAMELKLQDHEPEARRD